MTFSIPILILFAISIRFFLIDFKSLQPIRDRLAKNSLWKKWLECPFCNGFWVGLGVGLYGLPFNILVLVVFAITCGFVSFLSHLVIQSFISMGVKP